MLTYAIMLNFLGKQSIILSPKKIIALEESAV